MKNAEDSSTRLISVRYSLFIAVVWWSPLSSEAAAQDADVSQYLRSLQQNGIEPSAAAALAYFRELRPSAHQRAEAANLIAQLGDVRFARREAATARLLRMSGLPVVRAKPTAYGRATLNGSADPARVCAG